MKRLFMLALLMLVMVALGMALLLAPASAPPAAAYGGQASATMSCTDHTSTMTRIVIVTIAWHAVKDGVAEADAQAFETSPVDPLAWASLPISPPEEKGTASLTLSFNDTTPFGTVQWQLYNAGHIAPVQAGQFDAANVPGCAYP